MLVKSWSWSPVHHHHIHFINTLCSSEICSNIYVYAALMFTNASLSQVHKFKQVAYICLIAGSALSIDQPTNPLAPLRELHKQSLCRRCCTACMYMVCFLSTLLYTEEIRTCIANERGSEYDSTHNLQRHSECAHFVRLFGELVAGCLLSGEMWVNSIIISGVHVWVLCSVRVFFRYIV